jgi:hypothetical protein
VALKGDEGIARPYSAPPSSMRSNEGLPVPEEVLMRAQLHFGQEGGGRPSSAIPTALKVDSSSVRPASASPSGRRPIIRPDVSDQPPTPSEFTS